MAIWVSSPLLLSCFSLAASSSEEKMISAWFGGDDGTSATTPKPDYFFVSHLTMIPIGAMQLLVPVRGMPHNIGFCRHNVEQGHTWHSEKEGGHDLPGVQHIQHMQLPQKKRGHKMGEAEGTVDNQR
ncbi:hypothetical protein FIBSPDRAFT_892391 [Athelia psychrophila]|uniref:Uncharacterized protein n=1 Tax=Athelia psychrophila TaxID=1759441 RepID=A0A166IGL7_9AGAM|nr:hypothetical protein FIBSPDRAFT_892391 [Fibularhizoctonia sp. CBS 109695]